MLVLDTHTLVWWTSEPRRLGRSAQRRIADADRLGVPAIVYWEVCLLVRKHRLELGLPANEWVRAVESVPRVTTLPLTSAIAVQAEQLEMHPDPADRFIVATALHHRAPLVTKDRLLRGLPFVETLW